MRKLTAIGDYFYRFKCQVLVSKLVKPTGEWRIDCKILFPDSAHRMVELIVSVASNIHRVFPKASDVSNPRDHNALHTTISKGIKEEEMLSESSSQCHATHIVRPFH